MARKDSDRLATLEKKARGRSRAPCLRPARSQDCLTRWSQEDGVVLNLVEKRKVTSIDAEPCGYPLDRRLQCRIDVLSRFHG